VSYGVDVYDINEAHAQYVVDGNEWPSPEYDINGTTHYYIEVSTSIDSSSVSDLILSHAENDVANVDTCLYFLYGKNCRITGIRGRHFGTMVLGCVTDAYVDDIDVTVVPHVFPPPNDDQLLAASGVFMGLGYVGGLRVGRVNCNYSSRKSPFQAEVSSRRLSFDYLRLVRRDEGYWPSSMFAPHPVFSMQGDSTTVAIRHMSLESPGPTLNYLYDTGGEPGQAPPRIGTLRLRADTWQTQPEVLVDSLIIDPYSGGW